MFAEIRARVPGMEGVMLSTHTHDDLGMAVANTLAGLRGGARQVECTVNGIGERAGNASLEEIVMLIQLRRDALPFATDMRYEELGSPLTKPELERAYELFCRLADRKKQVYDEDLFAILDEGFEHLPETFKLRLVQSVASSDGRSTAAVELEKDGQVFHDSATAEGPCDAAFRSIDRITGVPGRILDFTVHTVGLGTNGVAEVFIRPSFD